MGIMKQNFNYHTHTYRCHHARGLDEEYIKAAIAAGFKTLGFSDHIPYPNHNGGRMRMSYDERLEYYAAMKRLKEKYKGLIDIYYGFESEYFEEYHDYYFEIKKEVDYLILGQHDSTLEGRARFFSDFRKEDYKDYERLCIKAMHTGLFKVLCHPDYVLLSVNEYDDDLLRMFEAIFKEAAKTNTVIEINLNGLERGKGYISGELTYSYPNGKILKIAKDCGCRFIFGADAHYPEKLLHFENDIRTFEKENPTRFITLEDFKIC